MTLINLSVRELALPVPRTGSIEPHSGYGRAIDDAVEIHLAVQKRRAEADATYQAEAPLSAEFEREGYCFRVGGRVDGLTPDPARLEEIKTTFQIRDLARKLGRHPDHPYNLQLKTYGYFYWLAHQAVPKLSFHLVSTRNREAQDLEVTLDIDEYQAWLERRLAELAQEARLAEKRAARRRKLAGEFPFPFAQPRPGQVELIGSIEQGMAENRRMLIQAPTGLGKTVGVLYPALKEAMTRGQRVIYVTPKNSQHAVAEDAVERFQTSGCQVKSLTVTAKSKICLKNEPLCNPDYCEYAKDHYTKVAANQLVDSLRKKKKLTARVFREMGEQYQVCPFELQMEAADDVDVVVCDYNYVFAPRVASGALDGKAIGQQGKPNLVIDEAHNLFARAIDYYSPSLTTFALEKMRPAVRELPTTFRFDAERLLNDCLTTVMACQPEGATKPVLIEPPAELFLEQDGNLRAFLSRYLDSSVEIQPRDVVLRLCFYWSEFTAALEYVGLPKRAEFFTSFQPFAGGGTVKISCCDASQMLKESYDRYQQVVGFSATLKPFDYYAKLSGLEPSELKIDEFFSPFPRRHRKLMIIPEISTKYSERERNYRKIAEAIARIAAVRRGNYFAFFPSFDFLVRVAAVFSPPDGFVLMQQTRDMRNDDVRALIDHLHQQIMPTLVFAVQGGVFSEGVDYPGEAIIGAFVIGPPLPVFDLEREQMREYYQKHYGPGFEYAYVYPAMAKAVQAAGRVIRSETDRGLIVLMDNRFLTPTYAASMPKDWFGESPRELVSRSILREVGEFWDRGLELGP